MQPWFARVSRKSCSERPDAQQKMLEIMADSYRSFAELATHETEGVHYRIRLRLRASSVAIVAPHGGNIEPATSEIAASIAANEFSLYCFEGLAPRKRGVSLHITSERFDEPQGLALVASSEFVVGVHGRKNGLDDRTVWLGGLQEDLRDAISAALELRGFAVKTVGDGHPLSGRGKANICNWGLAAAGVQLEVPRTLRKMLLMNAFLRVNFAAAVRETIQRKIGHRDNSIVSSPACAGQAAIHRKSATAFIGAVPQMTSTTSRAVRL